MATYYVSPSGSDSIAGTPSAPYRTITKAANQVQAGDTVLVAGGSYHERVSVSTNGTASNPIVFKALGTDRPKIDGLNTLPSGLQGNIQYTGLLELGGDYVTFEGFEVLNSRGRCSVIYGRNCTISNTILHHAWDTGITIKSTTAALVEDCIVYQAALSNSPPHSPPWPGALVSADSSNVRIQRCTVYNCHGEGIIILRSNNVEVDSCTSFDNGTANIYLDNASFSTVKNCLVYFTNDPVFSPGTGISISDELYPQNAPQSSNNSIVNNIVVGCGTNFLAYTYRLQPNFGLKATTIAFNTFVEAVKTAVRINIQNADNNLDSQFRSNLILQSGSTLFEGQGVERGITFSNNLWSRPVGGVASSSSDVVGDPRLANPNAVRVPDRTDPNWYILTSMSPAIDKGYTGLSVSEDFFGNSRDASPDIGMHEFLAETIRADFTASPTIGTAPLVVQFTDRSTPANAITSWFWDFGDGAISTERNPSHKYNQGQFTVSLRVAGPAGSDIATKSVLINVNAPESTPSDRVTDGLSALYRFDEGTGDTIFDVSGVGQPTDLIIRDTSAVRWLGPGLEIARPVIVASNGPASKINDACRESNEITLETWIKPGNITQDGPARIVSVSKNLHSRNITLGQGLWGTQPPDLYDVRLRTTERSANGMPSLFTPAGTAKQALTHIAFTRFSNGRARIIVNGVIVAETIIPGDFSTWNPRFPLLLANESTGEYPWLGAIYLVAVYARGLSHTEVKQNFSAGVPTTAAREQPKATLSLFRRFILVKSENGLVVDGKMKTVAYGVQYPDLRCVICANGKSSNMIIFRDVNSIIYTYGKQGLKLSWLD